MDRPRSYATQRRNPARHPLGITLVLLLHALLGWGLWNGLGRQPRPVAQVPVEVTILDELRPPPPEPPRELPPPAPPPRAAPPPPAPAPPRLVAKSAPLQRSTPAPIPAPGPSLDTAPAAPAPELPAPSAAVPAPPAPMVAAASAPPATPAPRSATLECPNYKAVLQEAGIPREAQRAGIESGSLELKLTIAPDGSIKDVVVTRSSNRVFNRGAIQAARQIVCRPQPYEIEVPLPVTYSSTN